MRVWSKKGKRYSKKRENGTTEARICRIMGNETMAGEQVWGQEWWRHRRLENHALEGSVGKHLALSKRVIKEPFKNV